MADDTDARCTIEIIGNVEQKESVRSIAQRSLLILCEHYMIPVQLTLHITPQTGIGSNNFSLFSGAPSSNWEMDLPVQDTDIAGWQHRFRTALTTAFFKVRESLNVASTDKSFESLPVEDKVSMTLKLLKWNV